MRQIPQLASRCWMVATRAIFRASGLGQLRAIAVARKKRLSAKSADRTYDGTANRGERMPVNDTAQMARPQMTAAR